MRFSFFINLFNCCAKSKSVLEIVSYIFTSSKINSVTARQPEMRSGPESRFKLRLRV